VTEGSLEARRRGHEIGQRNADVVKVPVFTNTCCQRSNSRVRR